MGLLLTFLPVNIKEILLDAVTGLVPYVLTFYAKTKQFFKYQNLFIMLIVIKVIGLVGRELFFAVPNIYYGCVVNVILPIVLAFYYWPKD